MADESVASAWLEESRAGEVPPPGEGELDIALPYVFEPLIDVDHRKRYYVAYGGRDSAKSWSFARALELLSYYDPLRILCAREIQRTIADSVHRLLHDTIKALKWEAYFEVQETRIINRVSGAEFLFAGLRDQDAHKIKSFEGVDVVWVEEAQAVTKRSWDILIPTVRAEGSEIWVSFNPDLDTDETYVRFVTSPPDDPRWIQKVTWRDNPWRSKVLDGERAKMLRERPDDYDNVYEGNPRLVVAGAIYAKEVTAMVQGRRFRPVPYDPNLMVHTIWDLGWNDQNTIVFAQRIASEVRIIDYEEDSFLRLDEWGARLRNKPYSYGGHWLPHDGGNETLQGGGETIKKQLERVLGSAKAPVHVIGRVGSVEDPIRAARAMFPRVYMDSDKCGRLLECLKRFKRAVPLTTGEPGAPVKDEFRHGADAYGQLALIVDKIRNESEYVMPKVMQHRIADRGMGR